MNFILTHRRAALEDLPKIIELYVKEDELAMQRELFSERLDQRYVAAFQKINTDQNHYLMIVEAQEDAAPKKAIVGTCHLTLLPSLTFMGSTRLQIEAVRVAVSHRGKGIGKWMMKAAIDYGKSQGALLFQLTTNRKRQKAKQFYECLGFQATHDGMKYSG